MLLTGFKVKENDYVIYVSNKQQNTHNLTLFQTDVNVFLTRLIKGLIPLYGTNLLLRVKIGYTHNLTFLVGHLEVPYKFAVVVVGCWCKPILVFRFCPLVRLTKILSS